MTQGRLILASVALFSVVQIIQSTTFHIGHRAICNKVRVCNGNLMCADVCEKGSVQLDNWIVSSLDYQRELQRQDQLVFFEMPSTHNSAITEADGYGIEKYFISALLGGANEDQGDDIGEGVCQYLTLTDQLRMGVRHLEIDLWWDPLLQEVIVCHSPIPLYPVNNITRTAEARNISLEWDPKKMSCIGTKRMFKDVLGEVNTWMELPDNQDELVVLYLDTKFYLSPEQVTQANQEFVDVFGDKLWKYSDGNPLFKTVAELLAQNKRVIVENAKECWLEPSEGLPVVFYPTLWTHQFGPDSMTEFPACAVEGDTAWYGKQWVRALDGSFTEAATRCGVQVVSGDYTNPDDMKFYVWSWDYDQPALAGGCVAMTPSGRWATLDCGTKLPFACASAANSATEAWAVDLDVLGSWAEGAASCPEGTVFSAPHNGFSNSQLLDAGVAQTVWLNAPNPL